MNPKNAHGVSEFDFLRDHQDCVTDISETCCVGRAALINRSLGIIIQAYRQSVQRAGFNILSLL